MNESELAETPQAQPEVTATTEVTDTPVGEVAPEATEGEPKAEAKKDGLVSDRLAQISKEEARSRKKLEALERRIADERAQFENQRRTLAEQLRPYHEAVEMMKTDPEAALERLGKASGQDLSYKALTHKFFGKAKESAIPAAEQERITRLENELRADREERARAELAQQARTYLTQIDDLVAKTPDDFEITRTLAEDEGSKVSDLVAQHVQHHYNATGELLTPEQACRNLETILETRAKRFATTGKVKRHLEPPKPENKAAAEATPSAPAAKTLTNKLASERGTSVESKVLSEAERIKRATEALIRQGF